MEFGNNPDFDEEENLIGQIEEEMRKIYLSVEKLYNNASLSETADPLEKCFISNYCYSACLLNRGVNDDADKSEDNLTTFEESLQQELNFLTNDMEKLIMKMNEYKDQLNSIDRNIVNLKQMMEAQSNEAKHDKKLGKVSEHLKLRFRKEKSDLKAIVSSLFPESLDIQDLIARIIDHHFTEGSDKYLQLEDSDNIAEQIELLRRTRLFDTNPHDPLQIKLADLIFKGGEFLWNDLNIAVRVQTIMVFDSKDCRSDLQMRVAHWEFMGYKSIKRHQGVSFFPSIVAFTLALNHS